MTGGLNATESLGVLGVAGEYRTGWFLTIFLLAVFIESVSLSAAVPLAEALDTDGKPITWSTVGVPAWASQTLVTHDGVDAAQSGGVTDNGAGTVQTTVTGPGTLSFWWKVSSETNKDFLKFFINGVQQMRISGEVDWQWQTVNLSSGAQVLKWTYSKNASLSAGQDCGWLDQVEFIPDQVCTYAITPDGRTHGSGTETGAVAVAAGTYCGWTVFNTNDWITITSDTNGLGSGTVNYVVASNATFVGRNGYVQIAGQAFAVTQEGLTCTFTIAPANRSHGPGSETGTVAVTTSAICGWSVLNTNTWITVISETNGVGSGNVSYIVATNATSSLRTGIVSIAGQMLLLSQLADQPSNTFVPLPEALDTLGFPFTWAVVGSSTWTGQTLITHDGVDAAQSGAVPDGGAVTLQTLVSGPGTITFWWKVSSEPNKDALKFFINGVQQVRITGEVDWRWQSYNLSPGSQTLKWTYSKDSSGSAGWDRGWVDQVQFIPSGGCLFVLSSSGSYHSAGAETASFTVTSSALCSWSVVNTNSWVTINSSVNNVGSGTVSYSVAANPGLTVRTGFLNVGDQTFSISQSGSLLPPRISIVSMSSERGVVLSVQGQAGRTNVIECSTDLVTWTAISTNVMPNTACPPCPFVAVTDSPNQGVARRFYRAIQLP